MATYLADVNGHIIWPLDNVFLFNTFQCVPLEGSGIFSKITGVQQTILRGSALWYCEIDSVLGDWRKLPAIFDYCIQEGKGIWFSDYKRCVIDGNAKTATATLGSGVKASSVNLSIVNVTGASGQIAFASGDIFEHSGYLYQVVFDVLDGNRKINFVPPLRKEILAGDTLVFKAKDGTGNFAKGLFTLLTDEIPPYAISDREGNAAQVSARFQEFVRI